METARSIFLSTCLDFIRLDHPSAFYLWWHRRRY